MAQAKITRTQNGYKVEVDGRSKNFVGEGEPPNVEEIKEAFKPTLREAVTLGQDIPEEAEFRGRLSSPKLTFEQPRQGLPTLTAERRPDVSLEAGKQFQAVSEAPLRLGGALAEKVGLKDEVRRQVNLPTLGKTDKSVTELMSDPQQRVLQPVTEKIEKVTENLPTAAKFAARGLGGLMTESLEPGNILTPLAGSLGKRALKGPQGFRGIGSKELSDPESGFQFKGSQTIDPNVPGQGPRFDKAQRIEQSAQLNPFASGDVNEMTRQNVRAAGRGLEDVGSRVGVDVKDVQASRTGERIQESISGAKKDLTQRLKRTEETAISPVKERELPGEKVEKISQRESKILDPKGEKIKVQEVTTSIKTDAVKNIDKKLESVGHVIGKEVENTGKAGKKAISKMLEYKKDVKQAKDIGQLLNVRRNIQDDIFENTSKGVFTSEKDINFLKQAYTSINNDIKSAIKKTLPGTEGQQIVKTFENMNKSFSDSYDVLSEVGGNLVRSSTKIQDVVDKIKLIDAKKLRALKESNDPLLKGLHKDMQKGAFESLIAKSIDEGELSSAKLVTEWKNLGKVKGELFEPQMIKEMDKLVDNVKKSGLKSLRSFNPPNTGAAVSLNDAQTKLQSNLRQRFNSIGQKYFIRTGKTPTQSVLNLLGETVGLPVSPEFKGIRAARTVATQGRKKDDDKEK